MTYFNYGKNMDYYKSSNGGPHGISISGWINNKYYGIQFKPSWSNKDASWWELLVTELARIWQPCNSHNWLSYILINFDLVQILRRVDERFRLVVCTVCSKLASFNSSCNWVKYHFCPARARAHMQLQFLQLLMLRFKIVYNLWLKVSIYKNPSTAN